jgi:thiamine kinase-like enzyme
MPSGHLSDAAHASAVLRRLPALAGQDCELAVLDGGLTNRNYRVTTPSGAQFVARFSSGKSSLLAIDRQAEYRNTSIAAAAGVAPRVIEFAPDDGVLLVEWITGRTFGDADLDDDDNLARVAGLCRLLHAAPRFVDDFDIVAVQQRYLTAVQEFGFRLPDDYLSFEPTARRMDAALRTSALTPVPCHNDLLAANILDDGARLWFIDFEYAGNNDPCFELGNLWSEAALGVERLEHLVACYFGAPAPVQSARARLYATLAKYCWTLWASIQASVSDVDFDFWQWGLAKYERARAELRDPDLEHLISTVHESN